MTDEAPKTNSKLAAWQKLGEPQAITLPSGTEVKIVVPDLAELLRAGEVPNELVKVASEATEDQAVTGFEPEKIKDATDFMRFLIATTVKEPEGLTPDAVPGLPVPDRDMILEFALRQRDTDAIGHQLYGLEKVAAWRTFRRRGTVD